MQSTMHRARKRSGVDAGPRWPRTPDRGGIRAMKSTFKCCLFGGIALSLAALTARRFEREQEIEGNLDRGAAGRAQPSAYHGGKREYRLASRRLRWQRRFAGSPAALAECLRHLQRYRSPQRRRSGSARSRRCPLPPRRHTESLVVRGRQCSRFRQNRPRHPSALRRRHRACRALKRFPPGVPGRAQAAIS